MTTLTAPVYNLAGQQIGTHTLSLAVFGVAFNEDLVHQAVVAQHANRRQVLAHTKGRGEVRGGGKKPWRQKGTGRARHGSRRSPLWSGGGITFGPTKERNFRAKINRTMKRQAVRMTLSDKAKYHRFVIVENWKLDEAKTKKLNEQLGKLPGKGKSTLLITDVDDVNVQRASKNLPNVSRLGVGSLNVVDLLSSEYIIISRSLVAKIEDQYKN